MYFKGSDMKYNILKTSQEFISVFIMHAFNTDGSLYNIKIQSNINCKYGRYFNNTREGNKAGLLHWEQI